MFEQVVETSTINTRCTSPAYSSAYKQLAVHVREDKDRAAFVCGAQPMMLMLRHSKTVLGAAPANLLIQVAACRKWPWRPFKRTECYSCRFACTKQSGSFARLTK
eukprot:3855920-Amphidinium_carterae.1